MTNRRTHGAAFWSLLLLFLYYNVDRWFPLGNWNGEHDWPVHNDQGGLDVVVAILLAIGLASFDRRFRPGMLLVALALGLWTYFHLESWWFPYLRGAQTGWELKFHTQFLANTQLLPRIGNHIPPDAEHTFIDVFEFPAFVLCAIAAARSFIVKRSNAN